MDHAVLELPPYQSLDGTNTKSDSLGGVLRAREIVHAGGFGPEDFALLDAVFQAAWHHIEIKCVEGDRKASKRTACFSRGGARSGSGSSRIRGA